MAKKIHFWTEKEKTHLTKLVKSSKTASEAAREFVKTSKRPFFGVQVMAGNIRKQLGIVKVKTSKTSKLNTSTQRGVELPGGFVFNFTPKKAEMYDNHVRLYF